MEYSKIKINKGLVKGSIILLVAFGFYNFFNFVFQLTMARMLSITDYGVLATLFSFIYILSVFTESIQLIISKYTTNENDKGKLKNILRKSLKKSLFYSSLLFIVYIIAIIFLSNILKIEYSLLTLSGIVIFSSFLLPITRGIMQGRRGFKSLGFSMISESLLKLVFSILFVFLGFRVYGAIIGTIIGLVVSFIFSFYSIKDILVVKEKITKTFGIYSYARPAFFITLTTIVFYSVDIVIARIVFDPEISGMYALASILSKSIFWGTNPINKAMFPLSAENDLNERKSKNVFLNAFLILIFLIFVALVLFYFFPVFIVKIFSGKVILESVDILFYLGLGNSIISLTNFVLVYKLSLGKTKGYYYLFIFSIIEIILLLYFSHSLIEFSIAFITASSIFLFGSIFLMND